MEPEGVGNVQVIDVHFFNWPPDRLRHVRDRVCKSRSLVSSLRTALLRTDFEKLRRCSRASTVDRIAGERTRNGRSSPPFPDPFRYKSSLCLNWSTSSKGLLPGWTAWRSASIAITLIAHFALQT